MLKRWGKRKFFFQHVPRELNTLADWLSKVAMSAGASRKDWETSLPLLHEDSVVPLAMNLCVGTPLAIAEQWEWKLGDRQLALLPGDDGPGQPRCTACAKLIEGHQAR